MPLLTSGAEESSPAKENEQTDTSDPQLDSHLLLLKPNFMMTAVALLHCIVLKLKSFDLVKVEEEQITFT